MMTAGIKAVRKHANGKAALGGSLQFEGNVVPEQLQAAYEKGGPL